MEEGRETAYSWRAEAGAASVAGFCVALLDCCWSTLHVICISHASEVVERARGPLAKARIHSCTHARCYTRMRS